jgi:hypothetical protein
VSCTSATWPFSITFGDTETNIGDTGITPITLGWHSGNFYWNAGLCIFAPTGKYDKRDLANTSLNHWAVIPTRATRCTSKWHRSRRSSGPRSQWV